MFRRKPVRVDVETRVDFGPLFKLLKEIADRQEEILREVRGDIDPELVENIHR